MAIVSGNFVTRLSGGAGNTSGNASLGGAKSNTTAPTTPGSLFADVSASEALAGSVKYRCVYLHNANAEDLMTAARLWVQANTPSPGTTVHIGLGSSAINGTEQTIANENTAPTGVTFSDPGSADLAIALGNLPAGQHRAFWIRRTVTAGAAAAVSDGASLSYDCETA